MSQLQENRTQQDCKQSKLLGRHDLLVLAANHLANTCLPFALLVFGDAPILAAGLLGAPTLLTQALQHLLLAHLPTHIHFPKCIAAVSQKQP